MRQSSTALMRTRSRRMYRFRLLTASDPVLPNLGLVRNVSTRAQRANVYRGTITFLDLLFSMCEFATIGRAGTVSKAHDVMLAELTPGSTVAGVHTALHRAACLLSGTKSARHSDNGQLALLVNFGTANAFGKAASSQSSYYAQAVAGVQSPSPRVLTFVTGVIANHCPPRTDHEAVSLKAQGALSTKRDFGMLQAIMTTDNFLGALCRGRIDLEKTVLYRGDCEGIGFDRPDMATPAGLFFTTQC